MNSVPSIILFVLSSFTRYDLFDSISVCDWYVRMDTITSTDLASSTLLRDGNMSFFNAVTKSPEFE